MTDTLVFNKGAHFGSEHTGLREQNFLILACDDRIT